MSEQLPSGESGTLHDPAELPRPAMWSKPSPGAQPVGISGRVTKGEKERIAERRLPLGWAGIAGSVVAVILLGVAVAAQSRLLLVVGLVLGAVGAAAVLRSRLMDAATVGQSVKDE